MLTKPKVLLVDDIEANLVALEAQLEKLDCDIHQARSGNDALTLLLKHEFAVMLLDVQMPEMDGYEVARYARSNPATADVPLIFVTAMHPTEENALRGYGAGAVDFLFKPINPDILRSKVQVFLELYQGKQKLAEAIAGHQSAIAELQAFSYSVSHDLRAPLRPLDGFSAALIEDYGDKLDDRGKDYLNRIRNAAQRMSALIDDLLTLSRMGQGELMLRPVDLVPIADSIVSELQKSEPERTVSYRAPANAWSLGDARLLRVALENLMRNAWKFTRKRAQAVIELGYQEDKSEAVIFVRDNGAGFNSTYAHKLFQPFQRLHSESDFEGTGIGLAIVQRIIRRHSGKLWAEGAPEEGAAFYFTLQKAKKAE